MPYVAIRRSNVLNTYVQYLYTLNIILSKPSNTNIRGYLRSELYTYHTGRRRL